jgi:hypothetical protein
MDLRTLRLAIATWEKRTSVWKGLSWQAGWEGDKYAQGWAGENGERTTESCDASQFASGNHPPL